MNNKDGTNTRTQQDWYSILSPLVQKMYDSLMVDPSSRRVAIVCPPFMPEIWESALQQALFDWNVPAITFQTNLETVTYAMGWKRGMVVSINRQEAFVQAHVDGHALRHTLQVVPCGYDRVIIDSSKIVTEWTKGMDKFWLDECNPESLILALLKCLEACPRETRRDVISNLVFVGETPVYVPDLSRRVGRRLMDVLNQTAEPILPMNENEEEETPETASSLVVVPTSYKTLAPLASHVGVTSTAPFRPDLVSWIGASMWAAAWHRHDDMNEHVEWITNTST
jgi:actin-related protein